MCRGSFCFSGVGKDDRTLPVDLLQGRVPAAHFSRTSECSSETGDLDEQKGENRPCSSKCSSKMGKTGEQIDNGLFRQRNGRKYIDKSWLRDFLTFPDFPVDKRRKQYDNHIGQRKSKSKSTKSKTENDI